MLDSKLSEAIELRRSGKGKEAHAALQELIASRPDDPDVNYQMAWTCDSLGYESEAVPYYEKALSNGLSEDRKGAFLGLGSTYRCLGSYEKSLRVLDNGLREFPNDRALQTFYALTMYNLGEYRDSIARLLTLLLDTTSDPSIQSYDRALRFYSERLDEIFSG